MDRTSSPAKVVCDAGPIIHLDELGCIDLMRDFESVLLPEGVYREVARHRPSAVAVGAPNWKRVRSQAVVKEPLRTMCRMFSLDAGEIEALAILTEYPDLMLLTDDAAARLVAENLNFPVHGTVGIIIRAIRRGLMTPPDAIDVLNRLPFESSLHIKRSLLKQVMSRVREEYRI